MNEEMRRQPAPTAQTFEDVWKTMAASKKMDTLLDVVLKLNKTIQEQNTFLNLLLSMGEYHKYLSHSENKDEKGKIIGLTYYLIDADGNRINIAELIEKMRKERLSNDK